jgi:GNAT superfamily N-acetyltransferase
MSELKIQEVDPFDEAAVDAWQELAEAVNRYEVGDHATIWAKEELRVSLQSERKHRKATLYNGYLDGELVVAGATQLPLLDNLSSAELDVLVHPEHRRKGLGSQMLMHLEDAVTALGRTRLEGMTCWPYDGPSDGAGTPGVEFGRVHGYGFGLGDVQRELPLPVDDAMLVAIGEAAAPYHSDYELRTWVGPFPDDLVQSYLEVSSTLMTEAPSGDMEWEAEAVDVEAFRMSEDVLEKQGRAMWHTVALDRDGTVVAYSDLCVPEHDPHWVFQWGTLVRRSDRGHRLGAAVKVANLRAMQASGTVDGRTVVTWNAEVNDHMIGINHQMGFVPTARAGELQKKLR